MICRSTGPPGTKCVMTKTASVIPMNVGITSSSRRMKYPVMRDDGTTQRAAVAAGDVWLFAQSSQ